MPMVQLLHCAMPSIAGIAISTVTKQLSLANWGRHVLMYGVLVLSRPIKPQLAVRGCILVTDITLDGQHSMLGFIA